MTKIIGLIGSPRNAGNTAALVAQALQGAGDAGAQTQIVFLNDLTYRGCQACYECRTIGCCAQMDDLVPVLYDIAAADAVILGTPNYMWQMTGQMKMLIDRFCSFMNPDFSSRLAEGKTLGLIFTQGFDDPMQYAAYYDMVAKSLQFLGFTGGCETLVAHGLRAPGEVTGNAELMARAYALGRRLVSPAGVLGGA